MNYGQQMTVVGPWGGQDGYYWDDGVHSTVRQLEIAHASAIDSVRIEYDVSGQSVWSDIHGGTGGTRIHKVNLNFPDEFLISLHGYYGTLQEWGPVLIRSLSFESNKRSYGPFGVEQGTYFTFPKMHAKIVGFLGKSGKFLDAIGVYAEILHKPISSNETQMCEYSMIQGHLRKKYDLILAVKQKDVPNASQPIILSLQISHDFSKQNEEPKIHEVTLKVFMSCSCFLFVKV